MSNSETYSYCLEVPEDVIHTSECGLTGDSDRIVGGWESPEHHFPWLVPIFNRKKLYCGGSIINNRYILTAGHCVRWTRIQDVSIEVAVHDRRQKRPGNMYYAQELIIHPDFFSHELYDENDIALIKVDRPIKFSNHVYPVCLPKSGSNYDHEYATVAGWGKSGRYKKLSPLLQETRVKILSYKECAKTQMASVLTPTVMCAYFEHADSCQGDSGGPLIYEKEPGKMEQIGVVSWGIGCGSSVPGIYTRLTEYLKWIYLSTADGVFCRDD